MEDADAWRDPSSMDGNRVGEPGRVFGPGCSQRCVYVRRKCAGAWPALRRTSAAKAGRLPAGSPDGRAPRAVVFFYGGSWREGDRKDYAFVGEALAAAGSIAMVADYRLYPEVRYPDFLLDCAAATAFARRWLDRQGYADARLFVAGHSAGAYNAAMLATDSRWLAMQGLRIETLSGWIGMAGPYNFLPIQAADVRPVFNHPNETADSQPLFHVRQDWLPPALLLTGEHDAYVDVRRNTLSLAERLTEYRHPVELKVYPRLDHKTLVAALASPLQFLGPVLSDVARFVANA